MSVIDRTLEALLDHLWDQILPTILARLADWSEPYCAIHIHGIGQTIKSLDVRPSRHTN